MNKSKLTVTVASAVILLAFCAFLFLNSAQDADTSGKISDVFVNAITPVLALFGIECSVNTVTFYVRKVAHFIGYFTLTLLLYSLLKRFVSKRLALMLSPMITLAIAIFDEFVIQRNSSGRSPEWRDVFIDLAGAITAVLLISLVNLIKSKKGEDSQ
ncbi:MAG: VanZ family protein [Clostridia bacterium]|nr:VanZ family protein [Clostridia bacterium]